MERKIIAALVGFTLIAMGLFVRANADSWSRNNKRGNFIYSFDSVRHAFLQDVGLVFLALGVAAFAVALNHWIAADRARSAEEPQA